MPHAPVIDTLQHAKRLEEAGVPREQAEAHADAFNRNLQDLVTKRDLKDLEDRMTNKLGRMMVVAIGIVGALVGVLVKFF